MIKAPLRLSELVRSFDHASGPSSATAQRDATMAATGKLVSTVEECRRVLAAVVSELDERYRVVRADQFFHLIRRLDGR